MTARWSNTRDSIAADERRMSNSEIAEMGGTRLHDRPNWPLSDKVMPERGHHAEGEGVGVDDGAVLRRREDVRSPGPDAPWLDDEQEANGEEDASDGEVSELNEDEEHAEEDGVEPTLGPDARPRLQNHLHPQMPSLQQQVSPEQPVSQQRPCAQSEQYQDGEAREKQIAQQSPRNYRANGPESPVVQPLAFSPLQDDFPSPRSNDGSAPRASMSSWQPSQLPSWFPDSPQPSAPQTEEEEGEARDIATPIPFADDTAQHSQSQPAPVGLQTQTNGAPTTSEHARGGSTFTGTPPSRSKSRASMHQTTQIPSHKERVRYSWQSLAGDEPNRPRIHIIKLVSEVATASAGFPGGEAFGFSISPAGRRIAAYNSARLYVLQTAALPVGISQDYALKRRPLAVEIVDEGNSMAILADAHTINIYDLGHQRLKRTKTIKTDFPTNCIALAPTGGLVAAAYEGGIEIFSLDPNALPTDRRAVRSQRMDRMTFSQGGSTLLGTTTRINVSSTVTVSVPVFPAAPNGIPTHQELKEAWCSELLHPENIRNSSHATFMRENRASCNDRVFAWNGVADTFGILNVSDMQYGNIDFPVVISPPLSTCGGLGAAIHSCPAIDEHGDTVAMIVNDRTIRLYIVPRKASDEEMTVEAHSIDHELDEGYGCPFSEVRWVYSTASLPAPLTNQSQVRGRLLVISPGGVSEQGLNSEELVDDIEGGRIILFDFDPQFAGQPGQTFILNLGKSQPQMLEEETVDVAYEVALARKRTVNQSKSGGLSQRPIALGRAATTFGNGPQRSLRSASPSFGHAHGNRGSIMSMQSLQSDAARSLPDLLEHAEGGESGTGLEEPYAQNAPRSQASLQRAASNAQRHRFQTLEERNQERQSVGSTGNFLPLPEYTEEPNAPLPSRFRAMAGLDAPAQQRPKPSIVTDTGSSGTTAATNGDSNSATPTLIGLGVSSLTSATPRASDTFSPNEAFRNVASQQRQDAVSAAMQSTGSGTLPIRSDSFASMQSMPRSLQRAYSNVISPLGTGPPPSLIGDWDNVSPAKKSSMLNGSLPPMSAASSSPSTVRESETWDVISPVVPRRDQASSPFSRAKEAAGHDRYSTSLLNPPGHLPGAGPNRVPSSTSSFETQGSLNGGLRTGTYQSTYSGRNLPTHMQAMRAAAASASLFPPTAESDRVPVPPPPSSSGDAGHPITAWHPPAPSVASMPAPGPSEGHGRKNSSAGRSAFPSTEKAKKLGFFKRQKRLDPYPPNGGEGSGQETMLETRSMMTWTTKRENKCTVM